MRNILYVLGASWQSICSRRVNFTLMLSAVALSFLMISTVLKVNIGLRDVLHGSIETVDIIVGSRTSETNLLMSGVFFSGSLSGSFNSEMAEQLARDPQVDWVVPMALGDSHKGFPVIATDARYFQHILGHQGIISAFETGSGFDGKFDLVLGSRVAEVLHYEIGEKVLLTHGLDETGAPQHQDHQFQVSGRLRRTGTIYDNFIFATLPAYWDSHSEALPPGLSLLKDNAHWNSVRGANDAKGDISLIHVKLKNPFALFDIQARINKHEQEPLTAILPGVVLSDVVEAFGAIFRVLAVCSLGAIVVAIMGLISSLLAGLSERIAEVMVFKQQGASRKFIFSLINVEIGLMMLSGVLVGLLFQAALGGIFHVWVPVPFKGIISLPFFNWLDFLVLLTLIVFAAFISLIMVLRVISRSRSESQGL